MSNAPVKALSGRRRLLIILLLTGGAFALRVLYTYQIRHNPFFAEPTRGTDMFRYDRIAKQIASGDFRAGTTAESPLYPYGVLPAIYLFSHGDPLLSRIIQAAFGSVTVLLIYLLAKKLAGDAAAVAAGIIAAFYPPFIIYDC